MARCFVIQPFDNDVYDKRYDDILKPAIVAAQLEPYRVDRDPGTTVLIDSIEREIRNAVVCLAEISTDNPNVWFEIGYALAIGKKVVMVCSNDKRNGKFPFDVQHRRIITYASDAPRDFAALQSTITDRLNTIAEEMELVQTLASMDSARVHSGLSPHEMTAMQIVMENQHCTEDKMDSWDIHNQMLNAGFTKLAASLSLKQLTKNALLELIECRDINDNLSSRYRITDKGIDWLLANQTLFSMRGKNPNL